MSGSVQIIKASTSDHLKGISTLQARNLKQVLSENTALKEGFVTMDYGLPLLARMNSYEPQIIAVDNEAVVGYALATVRQLKNEIPLLTPMFDLIERLEYQERKISDYRFYVMGQVCIEKSYRGKGVFKKLYDKHKEVFSKNYDLCITEVSRRNPRSIRAHEKVGFQTIHRYTDHMDDWLVLVLDLR